MTFCVQNIDIRPTCIENSTNTNETCTDISTNQCTDNKTYNEKKGIEKCTSENRTCTKNKVESCTENSKWVCSESSTLIRRNINKINYHNNIYIIKVIYKLNIYKANVLNRLIFSTISYELFNFT